MVRQEIREFYMDVGEHEHLSCTVPCSLYSVLYTHGVIGDPSVLDNAARIKRYSERGCVFCADFEVTPLIMSQKSVLLRFHGIDTLCRIELNGREIGNVDNMHRTYDFDVKTKIELGKNTLKLTFSSPKASPALRKAYSAFGADGAPELVDMGIFRKIEIIGFNHKIISDVTVKQTHSDKSVRLDLKVNTVGYDDMSRAVATLTSPAGNVYFCGFIGGEGSITVTDPNLWWPNGLGMQNLYKLNVNLYSDSDLEDTYEMKIGLRTVSLDTDGDAKSLMINGESAFVMGGEYMAEDILLSRISEGRTRALLEAAKRANFNAIFIHGSGLYPENYFFEACDELGITVFLEIPLCPSDTSDTEAFKESVKRELSYNLMRMAHHPSLAVIVGSERVVGLFDSGEDADSFAKSFSAFDGMNVFDLYGKCKQNFVRVGYDSLPTYESVVKFTEPNNRNLGSEVLELHGADSGTVVNMVAGPITEYPYANGISELSYVTGMHSAEESMHTVEAVRRGTEKPLGILMRRMNDTWPSVSASGIDYYGGRKPLYYYQREFFSPVRISITEKGTRVKFVVSNDMRQDYHGIFAYAIMNNKNQPVFRDSFPIKARAHSNLEVHNVDISSVIRGHEREYYLLYSVSDNTNEASKGIHLFTNTKRYAFLKPNYSIEITGNGMEYTALIGADCFVKGVEISFASEDVSVDNNYFNITGRAPVRVRLTTPRMTTVEKLKRVMHVRSVYDLGYDK